MTTTRNARRFIHSTTDVVNIAIIIANKLRIFAASLARRPKFPYDLSANTRARTNVRIFVDYDNDVLSCPWDLYKQAFTRARIDRRLARRKVIRDINVRECRRRTEIERFVRARTQQQRGVLYLIRCAILTRHIGIKPALDHLRTNRITSFRTIFGRSVHTHARALDFVRNT